MLWTNDSQSAEGSIGVVCDKGVSVSILATSSGNESCVGSLTGWRDRQYVARWFNPGSCSLRNLYRKVFSFRFPRRVLECPVTEYFKQWFLWSTAMMRLEQHRTKYLAFSRASTTASASPFYWCVTWFCIVGKSPANEAHLPTYWTTKWFDGFIRKVRP